MAIRKVHPDVLSHANQGHLCCQDVWRWPDLSWAPTQPVTESWMVATFSSFSRKMTCTTDTELCFSEKNILVIVRECKPNVCGSFQTTCTVSARPILEERWCHMCFESLHLFAAAHLLTPKILLGAVAAVAFPDLAKPMLEPTCGLSVHSKLTTGFFKYLIYHYNIMAKTASILKLPCILARLHLWQKHCMSRICTSTRSGPKCPLQWTKPGDLGAEKSRQLSLWRALDLRRLCFVDNGKPLAMIWDCSFYTMTLIGTCTQYKPTTKKYNVT